MFRTLRRRLILSHALPLLVIVPLMGLALIYVVESRVLLPSLASETEQEAQLIAEIAADYRDIWSSPGQANDFVRFVRPRVTDRVMLLDPTGRLLASSEPGDATNLGNRIEFPSLQAASTGSPSVSTLYSQSLHEEIADAAAPVVGPDGRVLGIVRLTYRLASVYERFMRLRMLVAGVLIAGLLLGAAVGWVLALNIEQPLRQVTDAIYKLAMGQRTTPLPEQGPEEIQWLVHAVNTLLDRLHSLEDARRQLLANLVHELGRPLGAMRSAVQALVRGADEDPALRDELLYGIDSEIGTLQRLLDDLTRLHDRLVGTLELVRRPTAMSAWLPGALVTWREAAQQKRLHWETSIPADLPTLDVDADRMAQALGNLVSNAIKYTPAGGAISVSAGSKDNSFWIRVADTGPGVAPDEQTRIFNAFYRGRQSRRFPQGMGLGLTIARDLVVAHGGRLDLESELGRGSQFTIRLPCS